jgi:mannose-1-phosphate guanylyltransferase
MGKGSKRRPTVHAVVMAGGAGTRFWPLSREAHPKPLLSVGGGRTLLGDTMVRARRVATGDRVWLVCGASHAKEMKKAAGLPARRVLVEPTMRNTAAAIALAAHRIVREDPEGVMAVLSADHRIPDGAKFNSALRKAAIAASEGNVLMTIGVKPTRPETGYGYLRLGKPVGRAHPGIHEVSRFVEKPDRAKARRYLKNDAYLWNAGIFVWRAATLLEELMTWAPEIAKPLAPLGKATARNLSKAIEQAYRRTPAVPIDVAVMERSQKVWCLPANFHWSDVGTWKSLAEETGVSQNVTRVIQGDAWVCDSQGNLVAAGDRPVVLLGVSNLVVVDAGDAILVADLDRSADVKDVVAMLRRKGRKDLL